MEAIRKIQTVKNGEIYLPLPQQFWGQEVEIIVLSSPPKNSQPVDSTALKKSLRGCLKHYANPDLMTEEKNIWQTVAGEKHEHR